MAKMDAWVPTQVRDELQGRGISRLDDEGSALGSGDINGSFSLLLLLRKRLRVYWPFSSRRNYHHTRKEKHARAHVSPLASLRSGCIESPGLFHPAILMSKPRVSDGHSQGASYRSWLYQPVYRLSNVAPDHTGLSYRLLLSIPDARPARRAIGNVGTLRCILSNPSSCHALSNCVLSIA